MVFIFCSEIECDARSLGRISLVITDRSRGESALVIFFNNFFTFFKYGKFIAPRVPVALFEIFASFQQVVFFLFFFNTQIQLRYVLLTVVKNTAPMFSDGNIVQTIGDGRNARINYHDVSRKMSFFVLYFFFIAYFRMY